jgi:hypothetical protein
MGWLKRKLKAAVKFVKASVRISIRLVFTGWGLAVGVFDSFLGFLTWGEKKLRIQIFILTDQDGHPVVNEADLTPQIDFARKAFKDRLNVKLLPYAKDMVQTIEEPAPPAALNPRCGIIGGMTDDFGEAGDFFAHHLAGWNAAPVSGTFPVTVFIVAESGSDLNGCSIGFLTDYVTVDREAVIPPTQPFGIESWDVDPIPRTIAHEIGHACNLIWHAWDRSNLMYGLHGGHQPDGDQLNWFQKNLFRSSRHVLYW